MIKGVLVAFGIMLVSALIPIAHFVLVPASPFIGGYFGISFADSHGGSYVAKGLIFGSLLGLLVFIVTALIVVVVIAGWGPGQKIVTLMWFGVVVLTLYTGSMSTLGAMYASLRSGG